MDPNANLDETLELVRSIKRTVDNADPDTGHCVIDPIDADRLAELVDALDGWIVAGGVLPARWVPMTVEACGWCCDDCLFYLANGETPVDMSEEDTEAWLAEITQRAGAWHVSLGGEHDDDCPNMADGQWEGSTDCPCETLEFSWTPCDVCGSHLGGGRSAVEYFAV